MLRSSLIIILALAAMQVTAQECFDVCCAAVFTTADYSVNRPRRAAPGSIRSTTSQAMLDYSKDEESASTRAARYISCDTAPARPGPVLSARRAVLDRLHLGIHDAALDLHDGHGGANAEALEQPPGRRGARELGDADRALLDVERGCRREREDVRGCILAGVPTLFHTTSSLKLDAHDNGITWLMEPLRSSQVTKFQWRCQGQISCYTYLFSQKTTSSFKPSEYQLCSGVARCAQSCCQDITQL
ncbi:hypothetical protein GGX14DRAFT_609358 [Mycena pura]|uniref:Hydrophobin n=1 Tax=Mycena pura TaxID=153505 RepID=A0AAD6UNG0_9AGAR|nr:hypothetical protein GGX14DRAFT_609358 [Mycena pura]